MNNSSYALYSSSNDGVTFGGGEGRGRRGVYLTLPKLIAAVVVAVLCVVACGLVVGLTVKNCPDTQGPQEPTTLVTTQQPPSTQTQAPTPTPAPADIRLPTAVLPESYVVVLAPYFYGNQSDKFYFKGSVEIVANVNTATEVVYLHRHRSLNVTTGYSVTRGDTVLGVKSVSYSAVQEWDKLQLNVSLAAGDRIVIKADFIAPLKPDLRGLYLSSYTKDGEVKYLATSQLQSVDARKTFPCFDEPKFKATFDITLVRPEGFSSISNMPSAANTTVKCTKWFAEFNETVDCVEENFEPTLKMSSYLLAFIVSEFGFVDMLDHKDRLFRTWARPEFLNIADYATEAGENITRYFEDYYDVEYPLNKTDQAAVPDFNAGAMENWGLIIYRESRLLYDSSRDTSAIKQAIGSVISHELAHMWFGNLVTPDWWDDIWLNEGFASFTQNLGVDQLHPDWDIDAQFVATQQRTAFNVDSKGASHPIYMPVKSTNDINSIFDSITYRKGATVLRMLYNFIGDEAFKKGIGEYLRNNSYGNTFHTALYEKLQEAVAAENKTLDVKEVMDRWILQMGHPVLNCSRPDNKTLSLAQNHFLSDPSQKADPQYPTDFNYTWIVPVTAATKENATDYVDKKDVADVVVWMTGKQQSFQLSTDSWYLLNLRSAGFYRVNYDEENWRKLIDQLKGDHSVFAPHDRARIIEDSFALAAADYIGYSVPMEVTKYLAKETHFVPWLSAMSQLSYLHTMLHRQSAEYGPFSAYMRRLLAPKFADFNLTKNLTAHLDLQMQNLVVTYACLYGVPECETQAKEKFAGFEKANFSSTFIKPDVRARVICEGVASSFAVQWDNLFDAMRAEAHPGMQNDMLRALGCSSEPWILNRLLSYAIDDAKIRRQDASTVFRAVAANPNGLTIVWDFLRENWDEILDRMPGSFTIAYFVENLSRFNTPQKLQEIREFKRANAEKLGAAAQQMDRTIEDVQINIRWMESNLKELTQWLADNANFASS